jgi:hypothetical protein
MARRPSSFLVRLAARCLHATYSVDRWYLRFDSARSLLTLAFASDALLEHHADVFYKKQGARVFLRGVLFEWEQHVIKQFFPPPAARVLVGGAGLGREAFGLAEMGYTVAAFEMVPALVDQMRAAARKSFPAVEVYGGAYQDLPVLEGENGRRVDLREQPPFDAAIIGWGSFGQLVEDAERTDTLRRFGAITRGPILVSFYANYSQAPETPGGGRLRGWLRQRARRRGLARFVMRSGYNRLMSAGEVQQMVKEAGLSMLDLQARRDGQPYFVAAP